MKTMMISKTVADMASVDNMAQAIEERLGTKRLKFGPYKTEGERIRLTGLERVRLSNNKNSTTLGEQFGHIFQQLAKA